ncbi:hypothetical protein [Nibricoccus aquaticus]|nr:hypothetical protein [Nibricoccus aquaticus]
MPTKHAAPTNSRMTLPLSRHTSQPRHRPLFVPFVCFVVLISTSASSIFAAPLSRSLPIDFFRDISSRNLKGLATRSDGRLVAGPVLTDLSGPAFADILWTLESSSPDSTRWLVGTGPEGKIFELTLDLTANTYTSREIADLDDTHVFALRRLPDGALLAGTSPHGTLSLIRDGKIVSRATLPADTIHDIQLSRDAALAYIATGNPGRIYELDLKKFAASTLPVPDSQPSASQPSTLNSQLSLPAFLRLLGEIKDRNARRLALLGDNLVIGSAPKGNLYTLPLTGGEPLILQENRDAEVATLLPQPNGDLYAALVFSNQQAESRLNRPQPARTPAAPTEATATPGAPAPDQPPAPNAPGTPPVPPTAAPTPPLAPIPQFPGRSSIVYFPKNGLPETVVSRSNLAFYALARRSDTLIIAGGEQGDILGYDLPARLGLTFPGTASAQINQIVPLTVSASAPSVSQPSTFNPQPSASAPSRFLLLRNNTPGLALLDFAAPGPREAETKRLDLGSPATLGALRFPRIREATPADLTVKVRTTFAADEAESWTPWLAAPLREDGWLADNQRGRYVKLQISLPASAANAQLDKPDLFFLPQNRRPSLTEFRIAAPGFSLVPPSPSTDFQSPPSTLGQLLGGSDRPSSSSRNSLNSARIFPQPGLQIVTWTLSDADDDELRSTFSIRRAGTSDWLDLAVNTTDTFAQFDTTHLADGVYDTRVTATEQAPRPFADRLTVTFETDDLVIDKTPPVITEVKVARTADALLITVSGRDAVSLLIGAEFVFNNGHRAEATQPDDAIRDSRAESFTLRLEPEKALNATTVEVLLYDELGYATSRRITL